MTSRILIIDFDARTLRAWRKLLTGEGYDVACARTADDVKMELRQSPPRLVILEPMLPGHDGFEVCRTVKASKKGRPPAVIIASRIFKGARYRGMARDAGADMFLEKPVKDDLLLSMVAKFATPAPVARDTVMASHPMAHLPEPPAPPVTTPSAGASPARGPANAAAPSPAMAAATDEDIEDALDRITFGGGVGLDPGALGAGPARPEPLAQPPAVGLLAQTEPARVSRHAPNISEDDLAAALDRLEMSTGGFSNEMPAASDSATVAAEDLASEAEAVDLLESAPAPAIPEVDAANDVEESEGLDEADEPKFEKTEIIALDHLAEPGAPVSADHAPPSEAARETPDESVEDLDSPLDITGDAAIPVDDASDDVLGIGIAEPAVAAPDDAPIDVAGSGPSDAPDEDGSVIEKDLLADPGDKCLDNELDGALSGESGDEEGSCPDDAESAPGLKGDGDSLPAGQPSSEDSIDDPDEEELHTGLQGMDRGTAELLSSLEELEGSLPTGSSLSGPVSEPVPELEAAPVDELSGGVSAEAALSMPSVDDVLGPASNDAVTGDEPRGSSDSADLDDALSGPASLEPDPLPSLALDRHAGRDTPGDPYAEDDAQAAEYARLLETGPKSRAGLWIVLLVLAVVAIGAVGGIWLYRKADTTRGAGDAPKAVDEIARNGDDEPSEIRWSAGRPPVAREALRRVPTAAGLEEPPVITAQATPVAASAPDVSRPQPRPAAMTSPADRTPRADPSSAALLSREDATRTARLQSIPEADLASLDRPLRLLSGSIPPELQPASDERGTLRVFLNVLIGPDGTVLEAKVVVEPGSGAGETVRQAVLGWRYSQPRKNDSPVKVWKTEAVAIRS